MSRKKKFSKPFVAGEHKSTDMEEFLQTNQIHADPYGGKVTPVAVDKTTLEHPNCICVNPGVSAKMLRDYMQKIAEDEKTGRHQTGNVQNSMCDADDYHTFFPNQNLIDLMLYTDNKLTGRPMPFRTMYIPVRFNCMGVIFNGMYAYQSKQSEFWDKEWDDVLGWAQKNKNWPEDTKLEEGWVILLQTMVMGSKAYKTGTNKKGDYWDVESLRYVFPIMLDSGGVKVKPLHMKPDGFTKWDMNKAVNKFINLFVNLIDFLIHPEVEYKVHKPDEKLNYKRAKKRKPRMPPRITVKVTGKTQKYLDAVQGMTEKRTYSHKFWVRGHYRHLTSDFYTHKQGQTIWVPPFIKGDKELIEKVYDMKMGVEK